MPVLRVLDDVDDGGSLAEKHLNRCWWCGEDPLYIQYHDLEWGRPLRDAGALFEFLLLEGAQAGLSWITILRKREAYRRAMAGFDPQKLAAFDETDRQRLLADSGIVRNRLKIDAAIGNARAFLRLAAERDPVEYAWSFVDGSPRTNRWRSREQVPSETVESQALSRDLKQRGFRFVGPTICYAFMQATGMVNDHLVDCWCHADIAG